VFAVDAAEGVVNDRVVGGEGLVGQPMVLADGSEARPTIVAWLARCSATVSDAAGSAVRPASWHHSENACQPAW
jgi:hypothetical protein